MQEKISSLLATEDEKVKNLVLEAINLARSRRLPAEIIARKLYQQLDRVWGVQGNEA